MTRYELFIHLTVRLLMGAIYVGFLLWAAAPAWAFVLFFAVTTNWGPPRVRR